MPDGYFNNVDRNIEELDLIATTLAQGDAKIATELRSLTTNVGGFTTALQDSINPRLEQLEGRFTQLEERVLALESDEEPEEEPCQLVLTRLLNAWDGILHTSEHQTPRGLATQLRRNGLVGEPWREANTLLEADGSDEARALLEALKYLPTEFERLPREDYFRPAAGRLHALRMQAWRYCADEDVSEEPQEPVPSPPDQPPASETPA